MAVGEADGRREDYGVSELVVVGEAQNRQEGLGVEILLVTGEDDQNHCHRTRFPRTTERREATSSC